MFTLNGNKWNTHNSTYKREIVSEINDTEKVSESNFPINLKSIYQYQRKYPSLFAKYKKSMHQKGCFHEGSNRNLNLIRCQDNIVIPLFCQ